MVLFTVFVKIVETSGLSKMAYWKKGKTFRKNGRTVRYIYKNGRKSGKKLVTVNERRNYRKRY